MSDNWKKCAQRLKMLRGAHMLREQDAARLAGVTVATWRIWESGKREPRGINPLRRFCVALGVSFDWIDEGLTLEERNAKYGPIMLFIDAGSRAKHEARIKALLDRLTRRQ